MTISVTNHEFLLLRDFIAEQCGIYLGNEKKYLIETRLSGLAEQAGCRTFSDFYYKINKSTKNTKLRAMTVDAITTNETLWFRDKYPFQTMKEHIFPKLYNEIKTGRRREINIWSAACATGQEPYSAAITAYEFYQSHGCEADCQHQVRILATDISSTVLAQAQAGSYDYVAICRGLGPDQISRYFRKEKEKGCWILNEEIRRMVTLKQMNLKDSDYGPLGFFDIIFLRNVMIYFTEPFRTTLFTRMAQRLNPKGYLFLGTGETTSGSADLFDIVKYQGSIFYQLKNT
ncbi:MAG: protein-glutamate O-methyltransferase CheR [Deltaproteobacteria bacterium]|nr:protein-glutamate O-methyltransferase CheR [Deltaproteobacteria bacterium]